MKVKLLKRLRNQGREMVNIHSFTETNGIVTGMKYGFDTNEYRGLFSFGDTEEIVKEKASRIYLKINIEKFRKKYFKYSRKK